MGGGESVDSMRCYKVSLPCVPSIGVTFIEAGRIQAKEFILVFMITKDVFIIFNLAKAKEA